MLKLSAEVSTADANVAHATALQSMTVSKILAAKRSNSGTPSAHFFFANKDPRSQVRPPPKWKSIF
jgi:hypothetical protein